jgi:hypothetical protein
MYRIKVKHLNDVKKELVFVNPKCGHTQISDYSLPFRCQDKSCLEEIVQVDKLIGERNQGARVRFFAEGKV